MESSDSDHEDFKRLFEKTTEAEVSKDKPGGPKKLTKVQQVAGTVRCDVLFNHGAIWLSCCQVNLL